MILRRGPGVRARPARAPPPWSSAGDTIIFVGDDDGARRAPAGAPEVDLRGRLLTPAFVDAHLHAVQAGLVMAGLDLHDAGQPDRRAGPAGRRTPPGVRPRGDRRARAGTSGPGPIPGRPPGRSWTGPPGIGWSTWPGWTCTPRWSPARCCDRLPGMAAPRGTPADGLLTRDAHHRSRGLVNAADRRRRPPGGGAPGAAAGGARWGWPRCTSSAARTSVRWRICAGCARSGPSWGSAW